MTQPAAAQKSTATPVTLAALAESWKPRALAAAPENAADTAAANNAATDVAAVRDRAFAALQAGLDWPKMRAPAWRHTQLGALPTTAWSQPPRPSEVTADVQAQLEALPAAEHRLVFVDGFCMPAHCIGMHTDSGPQLYNLADIATKCPQAVPHLGALSLHQHEAFAALNTTQLQDGALVYARARQHIAQPVQVVFIASGKQGAHAGFAVLPRVLVVAETGAQLSVSEHHVGGKAATWTNAVTELVVADNARLDYAILQHETAESYHLGTLGAHVGRDAHLGLYTFDDGAKLMRRGVHVQLQQAGAEAVLGHVALARAGQHQDTQATLQHAAGHTTSRQVFKTVVAARGSSAFGGMVDILPNAPKAAAAQMSRALLLASNAQAYLQPQLQILTDDVRCAHGATVGELDKEALFYLMSRGIAEQAAQELLTFAFLDDALRSAPASLRPLFMQRAASWLGMDGAVGTFTAGENA